MFSMRDPSYDRQATHTYADTLHSIFLGTRSVPAKRPSLGESTGIVPVDEERQEAEPVDVMAKLDQQAIEALRSNGEIRKKLESDDGMPWYGVQRFLMDAVLVHVEDRQQLAYNMLPKVLDAVYGSQGQSWETFKNPSTGKTWIRASK
jgi:hypothetical protein